MKLKEKFYLYWQYIFFGKGYIPTFKILTFILLLIIGYDFNELKNYINKEV